MELLRDNEEKVMCPYNGAHHIRKSRMEVHLKKCRLAYRGANNLAICDFNAAHRIPEQELQYHHDMCPDRKVMEIHVYGEKDVATVGANVRPPVPVPIDDSWDEVEVPTYDPRKYCESNRVLRRIDTESASIRRDFRIAERHRINNLEPHQEGGGSTEEPKKPPVAAMKSLPPTRAFSPSGNIENTPEAITEMMASLAMKPTVVIPTTKK
ncbi:gametocyte-specific factor 1 homolog [Anthonomus grandis grandis]|uniref:gametocyte-specific factor 1 homolog n=1 Tax=Anthonomus grandis grandis TaxID=2921223 RepID=UPI002166B98F|nr:gametocyte-specific factor 1 homolog [Anthonomus grandis grandis]